MHGLTAAAKDPSWHLTSSPSLILLALVSVPNPCWTQVPQLLSHDCAMAQEVGEDRSRATDGNWTSDRAEAQGGDLKKIFLLVFGNCLGCGEPIFPIPITVRVCLLLSKICYWNFMPPVSVHGSFSAWSHRREQHNISKCKWVLKSNLKISQTPNLLSSYLEHSSGDSSGN